MKLYEHTDALQLVDQWILEHDDEIRASDGALPDELAELLARAEGEFEAKAECVALMALSYKQDAATIDTEIKRLTARKKAAENTFTGLKNYLRVQMWIAKKDKIKTPIVSFWRQLAAPSVRGELDEETLRLVAENDPELIVVTDIPAMTVRTLNKSAIVERHKALEQYARDVEAAREAGVEPPSAETQPVLLPPGITVERTEFLQVR